MADKLTPVAQLRLPMQLVTRSDAGRLAREAETVDNFMRQAAIRQPGSAMQLPKTTSLFEEVVSTNKLNLLKENDRKYLQEFLLAIRSSAPVLHISFSCEPSPIFQQKLVTWLRQQLHPFVLLQIGLYPNIGAGCVVRSTNKYFDFSLRQRFMAQRELLIAKLRADDGPVSTTVTVDQEAAS